MSLFKDILNDSESLFLNPIALDYDYIPPVIKFRENQQQRIAECIKPLFQNRNGKNLTITGSPGIGKTLATRHVLKELEEETSEIHTIYLNCWKINTPYKIALELCRLIEYNFTHNKTTEELFQIICKALNKKPAVICLDEVDKLQDFKALYTMLEDIHRKTIILISNEQLLYKLDARIKSRLNPEPLDFKPYSRDETYEILKQRASYAFPHGVIEKEGIELATEKSYAFKDLRTGIYLMKEAGEIAESTASKKITLQHVKEATAKLQDFKIKKDDSLSNEQNFLLDLIKRYPSKSATELFKLSETGESYRNFRRKIEKLEQAKLIDIEILNEGTPGRTTKINLKATKTLAEFT